MLRVTIELVPFGEEEFAQTISEFCVANVGGDKETNIADYELGGYVVKNNKIEEIAKELQGHNRDDGVLKLIGEILLLPEKKVEEVEKAELLIHRTRLMLEEKEEDQNADK
jgi:hypothetical protein